MTKRLDVIEEAASLMMYLIGKTIDKELDMIIYTDGSFIKEKRKRLEDIISQAWTNELSVNSKDLSNKYSAIASVFWENEENSTIDLRKWEKVHDSFVEMIRIIDDMKAKAH